MRGNDGLGYGESKTRTALLSGPGFIDPVKPFEQMGKMLLRNPGPVVPNQQYGMIRSPIKRHMDLPPVRIRVLHRIMEQIVDNLLDLVGIALA